MNFFEKLALMPILMDIVEDIAKESLRNEEMSIKTPHRELGGVDIHVDRPLREPDGVDIHVDRPLREPDGVDIHVDRPLRENYYSHQSWARDMAEYRTLIDQAKKCDWPCKEPMNGMPNYSSHIQRDWYDENPICW